jgi:chaperonin cofactor prefoldin
MNIQRKKVKKIVLENDCEILETAKKLGISLDSEAIRNIIGLGMGSFHVESQLKQTVKELEEKKEELESHFKKTALQTIKLESKYVGVRNQYGRIFRDNRVLAMHLCAHTPMNDHERRMSDIFIQKYIIDSKLA